MPKRKVKGHRTQQHRLSLPKIPNSVQFFFGYMVCTNIFPILFKAKMFPINVDAHLEYPHTFGSFFKFFQLLFAIDPFSPVPVFLSNGRNLADSCIAEKWKTRYMLFILAVNTVRDDMLLWNRLDYLFAGHMDYGIFCNTNPFAGIQSYPNQKGANKQSI